MIDKLLPFCPSQSFPENAAQHRMSAIANPSDKVGIKICSLSQDTADDYGEQDLVDKCFVNPVTGNTSTFSLPISTQPDIRTSDLSPSQDYRESPLCAFL